MLKKIPGTASLYISEEGKMIDETGACAPLVDNCGNVTITMYNHLVTKPVQWVVNMADLEIIKHPWLDSVYFDITFIKKTDGKYQVVFPHPVYFDEFIRVVPGYHTIGCTAAGLLVNLLSNKTLAIMHPADGYRGLHYPMVTVPSVHAYGKSGRAMVHRLIALAWIDNADIASKMWVNHIDGNKSNYAISNLEWVTPAENQLHAVATGLIAGTYLKVKDYATGEVTVYPSQQTAAAAMGYTHSMSLSKLMGKRKRLHFGRYEVKYEADDSPWFFDSVEPGQRTMGYLKFVVKSESGTVDTYYDRRDFQKALGVWNISNAEEALARAKILHPNKEITLIKPRGENQAVQAYDLTTDTIHNSESIRQLAKLLGMDYSKVHGALNSPSSHRRGNFIFRLTTDQPWNVKEEAFKCSPMRILATSNSDSLIFDSIRDAAAHFKCSRGAIKCRLENDKLLNGYQFSRVDGMVRTPSE